MRRSRPRPSRFRNSDGEVNGLYVEFFICWHQHWGFEEYWLRLSKRERASWLGFLKVKSEEDQKAIDAAKGGGSG